MHYAFLQQYQPQLFLSRGHCNLNDFPLKLLRPTRSSNINITLIFSEKKKDPRFSTFTHNREPKLLKGKDKGFFPTDLAETVAEREIRAIQGSTFTNKFRTKPTYNNYIKKKKFPKVSKKVTFLRLDFAAGAWIRDNAVDFGWGKMDLVAFILVLLGFRRLNREKQSFFLFILTRKN